MKKGRLLAFFLCVSLILTWFPPVKADIIVIEIDYKYSIAHNGITIYSDKPFDDYNSFTINNDSDGVGKQITLIYYIYFPTDKAANIKITGTSTNDVSIRPGGYINVVLENATIQSKNSPLHLFYDYRGTLSISGRNVLIAKEHPSGEAYNSAGISVMRGTTGYNGGAFLDIVKITSSDDAFLFAKGAAGQPGHLSLPIP
jgi:hypothetical protein